MITYDSIKEKLGFDPVAGPPIEMYGGDLDDPHEDDSKKSPWSVLTLEEFNWLDDNGYRK